jgi:iron(III) transport system substrate-binding protein
VTGLRRLRVVVLFAIAAICFVAAPVGAADKALIDAAEKEGSLVIYSCDPPGTPGYVKRFNELYPKIKVNSYLAGCWTMYNRHVNERSAGKPAASVFFSIEDALVKAQAEGLLEPYESPELAHFPKSAHPADYTSAKSMLLGMGANGDYLKGVPGPTDWSDFANPPAAWDDKITFQDPRTSSAAMLVLSTLVQNFGRDQAGAIYQSLIRTHAELEPTTPAGMAKLVSGEKPIIFYFLTNAYSPAVAKGAPLTFTVPKSGTIAVNVGVALMKDAPSPNAGKLFIDFMLSDAQKLIASQHEYALRAESPGPSGLPALVDVKFLPLDIGRSLKEQPELLEWWQTVTAIR